VCVVSPGFLDAGHRGRGGPGRAARSFGSVVMGGPEGACGRGTTESWGRGEGVMEDKQWYATREGMSYS